MKTKALSLAALFFLLVSCSAAPKSAAPIPPELSIEEHLLTRSPEAEFAQLYFAEGTQEEILAKHAAERSHMAGSGSPSCTVENQMAHCTRLGQDQLAAWTEYGSGLFSTGKVIVALNGKPIYTIPVGDSSPIESLRGFGTYDNHWILETANVQNRQHGNEINSQPTGQITIDGKLINKQFGYQEAFGFQTMHGKPFYFYKKDDKINISYAGVDIPTGYDEIPHYGCCSAATLNPDVFQNMVAFFARKGTEWYYVEIGAFEPSPTASSTPTLTPTRNPLATLTAQGLVLITRQVVGEPVLDPLNFETVQGERFQYRNMGMGEFFPSNWVEDVYPPFMEVELNGDRLVAREQGVDLTHSWVTVERNGQEIYRIESGSSSPLSSLQSFWTYDGHWVLETARVTRHLPAPDTVVGQISLDGELLNTQYGYDEAFGFQTIHGRPFYFFKRDGKVDAVYDGQEIALGYDRVPHFGCCSPAELNPHRYQEMVAFFGIIGETWYFVQLGTPEVFNMVLY